MPFFIVVVVVYQSSDSDTRMLSLEGKSLICQVHTYIAPTGKQAYNIELYCKF
jgi:hypothetical protein